MDHPNFVLVPDVLTAATPVGVGKGAFTLSCEPKKHWKFFLNIHAIFFFGLELTCQHNHHQ